MFFGLFGGEKKRIAEMIAAARSGDTEKIKQLLSKGADINAPEPESGDTPLLAAIDKHQWAAAEHLLKQGPDLSLEDKNGNSPLYLAVSRGDSALAMVNLLLKAGAPVNLLSPAGYTPLYIAAGFGDAGMTITELLLAAGAQLELGPLDGDGGDSTALYVAASRGGLQLSRRLLAAGASSAVRIKDGSTLLHAAAMGGNAEVVRIFAGLGVPVGLARNDGITPLHVAAISGQADAAAVLIDLGAALELFDGQGRTPLMAAAFNDRPAVVKLLLARGAKLDVALYVEGTPLFPLFIAAMDGYHEVVRVLLEAGAAVDFPGSEGMTPLMSAVLSNHAEVVRVLLDHGADPEVSAKGTLLQPLLVAALNGHGEVVRVLLDKGAKGEQRVGSMLGMDADDLRELDGVPSAVDSEHNGHEVTAQPISVFMKIKMAISTANVWPASKVPTINYTEEQTARLVSAYQEGASVEELAAEMGKSIRSVIAKLSREGVYQSRF